MTHHVKPRDSMCRRTALASLSLLGLAPAYAMGPLALIMVPIATQAVVDYFAGRRQEEAQFKMMSAQFGYEWAVRQMAAGDVERAHATYRGALLTLGVVSRDADGYGTTLGIHQGRVFVERGGAGGYLTPGEVESFKGYGEEGRPLPVPVEPDTYPSRVERSEGELAVKVVAARKGLDPQAFRDHESPAGMRRFSSGRVPRAGGDMATLLTVDRKGSPVKGDRMRVVNTHVV